MLPLLANAGAPAAGRPCSAVQVCSAVGSLMNGQVLELALEEDPHVARRDGLELHELGVAHGRREGPRRLQALNFRRRDGRVEIFRLRIVDEGGNALARQVQEVEGRARLVRLLLEVRVQPARQFDAAAADDAARPRRSSCRRGRPPPPRARSGPPPPPRLRLSRFRRLLGILGRAGGGARRHLKPPTPPRR